MTQRGRLWLFGVALVCGIFTIGSLWIYAIYFQKRPLQDWMIYYTAARAYLEGNLPLILDPERLTALLNATFAEWLPQPFPFRSWAYPPPFLLFLIPFGLLSFVAGWAAFQLVTFAALLAAIWSTFGTGYRRWVFLFALLLSPALAFNVGTGQNGFLTTALLVGGFGLLPHRPGLAGVLLGLLTYKPQFWPLAPIALVAAGQWRVLVIAIATAGVVSLVSLVLFGFEPWRVWIEWAVSPPAAEYQKFLDCCRLHDESVFTNLIFLGMPKSLANVAQGVAILLAIGAVWWTFRRPLPAQLQLAVLLAASALAAPHVANYDAILLVVAATIFFVYGLDHGFQLGGVVVPVLVWMMQLFNPPDFFPIGRSTPFLTLLLIACTIRRARAEPAIGAEPAPASAARPLAG